MSSSVILHYLYKTYYPCHWRHSNHQPPSPSPFTLLTLSNKYEIFLISQPSTFIVQFNCNALSHNVSSVTDITSHNYRKAIQYPECYSPNRTPLYKRTHCYVTATWLLHVIMRKKASRHWTLSGVSVIQGRSIWYKQQQNCDVCRSCQMIGNEFGSACSMWVFWWGNLKERTTFERPSHKRKSNLKFYFKEIWCDVLDWINQV